MNRARFLQATGSLVVFFAVRPRADAQAPAVASDVDSWLRIEQNGNVTVMWGKVELGTGISTAIAQLVADELYVPLDHVRVADADTAYTPNQGYTAGSQSLAGGAIPVRRAAAVARGMLVDLAARRWNAQPEQLETADGAVFVPGDPSRRVPYGELIGGLRLTASVPASTAMRRQTSDRLSGSAVQRRDIPAKVAGTFSYLQDVAVLGMLHARVVYPPRPDAELRGYDEGSLRGIPERIQIFRKGNLLAVVARDEWHAVRAQRELAVSWGGGRELPEMTQLAAVVAATPGTERLLVNNGDVGAVLRTAANVIAAEYSWPFQSHGSIGPSCAIADVRRDSATVWSSTQGIFPLRGAIAQLLDMPSEAVRVIYVDGAGCYGQNGSDDAAAASALISQDVGAPVRLQYMRADETAYDPKGPASVMRFRGVVDSSGAIAAWENQVLSPSHGRRPDGHAGNTLAGMLTGAVPGPVTFVGGDRNAPVNYRIPAMRVTITDQPTAILRQSSLRGLGGTPNTFGNESFMDELAHAAGADPIEFRLRHLEDDRAKAVLEAVRSDYKRGRGVAFVRYESAQAIVAAVADVTVDRATGRIRVNHVWIAHDCGFIVNPDGLRNQIEGNVIQAASRALLEEVHFDRRSVTSIDWRTYPILRFKDVPGVTIRLIDRPDERVLGAGEPATTVVAPAIANAVYAQTGARLRRVPFTPAAVKAALQGLQPPRRSAMREKLPAT